MANAVLIAVLGMALILFGLEDFLREENRKRPSIMLRATTLVVTGLYLLYLFQEMGGAARGHGGGRNANYY